MFTAEELNMRLSQKDGTVSEHLEISNFEAYAIDEKTSKAVAFSKDLEIFKFGGQRVDLSTNCEQVFRVHRGLKNHFASPLDFWVASLNALNWDFDYHIKGFDWNPKKALTEAEFYQGLDFQGHVPAMNPVYVEWLLTVRLRGAFERTVLVDEDWNNLVVFAESEQENLAFFWHFYENTWFSVDSTPPALR